jgi:Uma2 family endonuclease
MERMTTTGYLSGPETLKRRELVWGVLREPPSPFYSHQRVVTDLAVLLHQHTRVRGLGQVCVSPIDVVLDGPKALILQPDIVFMSTDRLGIVNDQIWGAPDLVVEVLSQGTSRYDQGPKLGWFRKYGVRECWLVNPGARQITVHTLEVRRPTKSVYEAAQTVRSCVLPELELRVTDLFGA